MLETIKTNKSIKKDKESTKMVISIEDPDEKINHVHSLVKKIL